MFQVLDAIRADCRTWRTDAERFLDQHEDALRTVLGAIAGGDVTRARDQLGDQVFTQVLAQMAAGALAGVEVRRQGRLRGSGRVNCVKGRRCPSNSSPFTRRCYPWWRADKELAQWHRNTNSPSPTSN